MSFDTQSLWMYAPRGEPKELTRFDGFVWSFDVAGDGKSVIVGRGRSHATRC
ncbi:MAG TPA: hypothetical protein VM779_14455 [Thermoanaerobaculia bacterium]|nr:hypothetical protein [Thermoanaerobaculia bacterium]